MKLCLATMPSRADNFIWCRLPAAVPCPGAGPAPSLRGASRPMQLFRVLRLLWMLKAFLGSTGEEAWWGRAAETLLMSQGRVCVCLRGGVGWGGHSEV